MRGAQAYCLGRGGEQFSIEGDLCLLGRSREAQMRFSSPRVSRRHALVRRWQGRYYIQDLGGRAGTYVNGRRVTTQALRSGDVIQLGDVEVEFREAQ